MCLVPARAIPLKMVPQIFRHAFQICRSVPAVLSESKLSLIYPISTERWISTSSCLFAEPLKKKKRIDPAVVKAREDRKKRKLEKQIRRLEKHASQLKPLDELEVPLAIVNNYHERVRAVTISPEEEEARWMLQKEWTRYMFKSNSKEFYMIDRILSSQHRALEELRKESEDLYQAAIKLDFSYIPCEIKGPVETPPIKGYVAAEGDFIDVSRKWE